jgi:Cu(I)/Ag(I) efflux system membrane fusion protein
VVPALLLALGAGYWAGKTGKGCRRSHRRSATPLPPHGGRARCRGAEAAQAALLPQPMGLPDTSPVPKKDSMGMDYIAVYEGEDDAARRRRRSEDQYREGAEAGREDRGRQPARTRPPGHGRRPGRDRRTPRAQRGAKFEGWVERLHVNATGQPVGKGQPLFEVYSPELVSAQREYVVAAKGVAALKDASAEMQSGMRQLADASLSRLRNWDISEEQIKALAAGGERSARSLSARPPAAW